MVTLGSKGLLATNTIIQYIYRYLNKILYLLIFIMITEINAYKLSDRGRQYHGSYIT